MGLQILENLEYSWSGMLLLQVELLKIQQMPWMMFQTMMLYTINYSKPYIQTLKGRKLIH
mgnify:FL=1